MRTLLYLAKQNIMRRLRVAITVVLATALTIAAVVVTWAALDAERSGIELARERQGSDIVVYPNSTMISDASMLYTGIAQSVYMDASVEDAVRKKGAAQVSGQFYLQTLPTSGCCAVSREFRIVGIDYENDFAVKPWLDTELDELTEGSIILGCNLRDEFGDSTIILNVPLNIVASLEPTGTYLDDSVIMDITQARKMAAASLPPNWFGGKQPRDLVTCVLIRLDEGVAASEFINTLTGADAKVVSTSSVRQSLNKQLDMFGTVLMVMLLVIMLLCLVTMSLQFKLLIRSRTREAGYLRSIGMRQKDIRRMFLMEFGIMGTAGGLIGSIAGAIAAGPVIQWVKEMMSVPVVPGSDLMLCMKALCGVLLAVVITAAAVIAPLRSIGKMSPYEALTKGEL